ncbi:hypothetical protein [Chitinophaga lutea]|nr:hypothetical protein [Chitinophaga lutea]
MKISTMRSRLHEAIDLAPDARIRELFDTIPLEVSRSEFLTLEQIQSLVEDAENFIRQSAAPEQEEKTTEERDGRMKKILVILMKQAGAAAGAD